MVHVVLVTHGLLWKRQECEGSPSLREGRNWVKDVGPPRAGPRGLCQELNREQMREDVLTQSEILGADPGGSFLSRVSDSLIGKKTLHVKVSQYRMQVSRSQPKYEHLVQ